MSETGNPAAGAGLTPVGPPPMVTAVVDRMRQVVGVASDIELAEHLGIGRSTPGNWRSRDKFPLDECLSMAIRYGVSLDWLLFGEGVSARGASADSNSMPGGTGAPAGHVMLERLKGYDTSPGPDRLFFPEALLRNRSVEGELGAGLLRWMVNPDAAMDPTFPKGALLLVDAGVTTRGAIQDGETYVIRFATRLLVRRIFIIGNPGSNEYRLAGYRPREGRRDLTGPDYKNLEIGGRVVDVI